MAFAAGAAFAQIETGAPPTPIQPGPPPSTTGPSTGPTTTTTPPQASQPAGGLGISQLDTKDERILYFDPSETYLTPYVGRALENSIAFQEKLYGWKPWDRTTLLLKDFADYGNAAARASPNDALLFDISPLSQTFETFAAGERFFTLANHEETHVATMDVWDHTDAMWRDFFHGKPTPMQEQPESILYNYLATPRVNVPRWYLEGSAVFMETWMAGGFGRAQGGYDEMVFRAMVRDNARFFSPLGLAAEGDAVDFQVGVNDYLYGTRFFSYMALTHSPEKVIQWLRRDEGSAPYYATQFQKVFGEPLDQAWNEWIAYEHTFQQANLQSVSQYPLTPLTRLTSRGLGSVSRQFYDPASDSLIGAYRYPGVIGFVGVLDLKSGKIRHVTDIKGLMLYEVTSMAYDAGAKRAWYTTDNYAYRDLMEVNLTTGATKMLIHDGRIGDIVVNPVDHAIWGIRHANGLSTLVRIPPPYTDFNQVHTYPFGETPFDLDISPDGNELSESVGEVNGDQFVRVFRIGDMSLDDAKPVAELKLGTSTPESFVWSPDGKYLYGSSYYTGVSNIYRFDPVTQDFQAVSNASTGLFRPIPRADGSLIAFEYTGQGFSPVTLDPKPLDDLGSIKFLGTQIADQHPIVKTWAVGSPANVPLDKMITYQGPYDPLHEMTLDSEYPILEGYKLHPAYGWNFVVEDPMQLDQLQANIAYSPAGDLSPAEDWHVNLDFKTFHWRFRYWHNHADPYDLAGPIDNSLRGDAILIDYKNSLVYDPPAELDLTASTAAYFGLDTVPGAQNIGAGLDRNVQHNQLELKYTNDTKSLGAVEDERGVGWNFDIDQDFADEKGFPSVHAGFDVGRPLGSNHVALWFFGAAGAAGGYKNNPLGLFYLGSFLNNYLDDGDVKRFREFDSFPGFGIDAISARSFAKGLVELDLPPLRFDNLGRPSFFLSYLRPEIFTGVLADSPGNGPGQTLEDIGLQGDLNFTVAFRLPMTLSFGYAAGFQEHQHERNELMVSLKIM
ncbi:MAG TPA: hypothetical protein VGL58_11060 [Caulobacteraceae bacterium]